MRGATKGEGGETGGEGRTLWLLPMQSNAEAVEIFL